MLSEIMVRQGRSYYVNGIHYGEAYPYLEGFVWATPFSDGLERSEEAALRAMVPDLPLKAFLPLLPDGFKIKYDHEIVIDANERLVTVVSRACRDGLLDLCRALGISTDWDSIYYTVDAELTRRQWKRKHVLPLILEYLYNVE